MICYLGLGSNLGDREGSLCRAAACLSDAGVECVKASSVYESEPFGYSDQPAFLNAVIEARTRLSAQELLTIAKEIERLMGRVPGPRWGPRPIDIDILLYDDLTITTEELTVPHPGMQQRPFVLLPLHEIAPGVNIGKGMSVERALESLDIDKGIKKYAPWRCEDVR